MGMLHFHIKLGDIIVGYIVRYVRRMCKRRRRMKIAGMSELQAQQLELASKTQPWWKKGGETKMSDS